VALAARSFGVAASDITAVGQLLDSSFNQRCIAPAPLVPGLKAELQSICTSFDCPIAANANCGLYALALTPKGSAAPSATTAAAPPASATGATLPAPPPTKAGGSSKVQYNHEFIALLVGFAVMMMM
ncbi:hypothetical protein HDU93_004716, partial [Gonapodya sp. JEL0774]